MFTLLMKLSWPEEQLNAYNQSHKPNDEIDLISIEFKGDRAIFNEIVGKLKSIHNSIWMHFCHTHIWTCNQT